MKNKLKTILVVSLCMVIVSAISVASTIAFLSSGDNTSPLFYIAMAAMALAGVVMLLLAKKQPVGY